MKIVRAHNRTKEVVLAPEVAVATSIWARFWGLMGKAGLPEGGGLLLTPCSSVHMFFMRFPLDVVFLEKSGRVTKVVRDLKPWKAALGGGGKQALELKSGAAELVDVGDQIEFQTGEI
jgi:uncharacterized membrane protein (UPF0127 family)